MRSPIRQRMRALRRIADAVREALDMQCDSLRNAMAAEGAAYRMIQEYNTKFTPTRPLSLERGMQRLDGVINGPA